MTEKKQKTVVSGIRPTGNLHLGNYFGAVRSFVKMQSEYRCYFFIADLHSLTTHPTPDNLQAGVKQVLAEYLACGIDPEQATIFIQSDVPEVVELYTFLNMNAYLGELERTTSFKEKARQNPDNVNAGLLTYPVLMAADIIIHKAAKKAFDELGMKKLPTVKTLQAEYAKLLSEKKAAYAEYSTAQKEMRELLVHKKNIEIIFGIDEPEQARRTEKEHDRQ